MLTDIDTLRNAAITANLAFEEVLATAGIVRSTRWRWEKKHYYPSADAIQRFQAAIDALKANAVQPRR